MNNIPGIDSKSFYIHFDSNFFNKGDILVNTNNFTCKVLKVYKLNWWKRLLIKLGFKVKLFQCKVIKIE